MKYVKPLVLSNTHSKDSNILPYILAESKNMSHSTVHVYNYGHPF